MASVWDDPDYVSAHYKEYLALERQDEMLHDLGLESVEDYDSLILWQNEQAEQHKFEDMFGA